MRAVTPAGARIGLLRPGDEPEVPCGRMVEIRLADDRQDPSRGVRPDDRRIALELVAQEAPRLDAADRPRAVLGAGGAVRAGAERAEDPSVLTGRVVRGLHRLRAFVEHEREPAAGRARAADLRELTHPGRRTAL